MRTYIFTFTLLFTLKPILMFNYLFPIPFLSPSASKGGSIGDSSLTLWSSLMFKKTRVGRSLCNNFSVYLDKSYKELYIF
jgi:hypothetical protein